VRRDAEQLPPDAGPEALGSGLIPYTTERSTELYHRALELLPGGVNSPVRAMRSIGRDPIFIASGQGSTLVDVDGNEYTDWVSSWGPLIAGHAHPAVVDAVASTASDGTTFGAPTKREVTLAAEVASRIPSVEMVRMTSSGTEATMSAIRLARATTGRDKILKFAGAYHGHVDGLLAEAGSGMATQGIPASPGVPAAAAAETVIVPWNDPEAVIEATERHELAAILAEPVPANMGVVPPAGGFLDLLRARADETGALLIFDEVITGFRVARGGAQESFGVMPDLTVMGKIIGGGLPAAAYGGAALLMERIAPAGDVYQAGTLSGNPLAVAAALATLELLDGAAYERLERTTEELAQGLSQAADDNGVPLTVQHVRGLLTPFFTDTPVTNYAEAAACDLDAYAAWCRALLVHGVYPPASQFEAWFPSLAHTARDLERTLEAARSAFREIAR
jgi:glutamate-1-semialdehyde 2,1-aminomutase